MRVVHGLSPGSGPWTGGQCYVYTRTFSRLVIKSFSGFYIQIFSDILNLLGVSFYNELLPTEKRQVLQEKTNKMSTTDIVSYQTDYLDLNVEQVKSIFGQREVGRTTIGNHLEGFDRGMTSKNQAAVKLSNVDGSTYC